MRAIQVWVDNVHDKENNGQCIYDLAFRPDGEQLIATAGSKILVYNVADGAVVQTLRGHKENVYCLSYARDGRNFASGSADKSVIIWTQEFEGVLRFSLNDTVQCLAYSPVSKQVLCCSATEVGLWSPEAKSVAKSKSSSRVCCCSWTNDGQYFALGHYTGLVTVWTKNGEEKVKIERPGGFPVWTLSWNPSRDDQLDILTVCDWGQRLSYYQLNGRQLGKDRHLGFDACSVNYFPSGDFSVIGGSNKKACIYSREGVMLSPMGGGHESWVWTCKPLPLANQNFVVVGCQDGTLIYYQLLFNTVHALYRDRYVYRERVTEVVVQHLVTNEVARIKCHDRVKKIAVYKRRLAVQLPDKIVIYESASEDPNDLHYKIKEKVCQKHECSLLVVCGHHVILCQEKRLHCHLFTGEKEREWVMESQIRYIKVVGGPTGREALLVGLRNGQVLKIFMDNPFPIALLKQQTPIRCLDLNANRTKLAVVGENNTLMVYNITSKELLFQEPNANSVAWNTQYEDMLCYSGSGMLNIKASNFPVHQQKQQGFVVGFSGSKIFCLHFFSMSTIDVPQSAPMIQYLERKLYRDAYKIACLGVTEGDWRVLALEALEGMDFDTAKKAFIRVRDLGFLELIHSIEERKRRGEDSHQLFLADIFAYQGKFQEAAQLYRKAGYDEKAVEMFTDLRQFEQAKEFVSTSEKQNVKQLITKQAEWAKTTNDPQAACDMYTAAGEYLKAVDIMGENEWVEKIVNLAHELDKSETEVLQRCTHYLKKLGQTSAASEVLEKMGDIKSLVALYVDTHQWENGFELAEKYPEFKNEVYMPYATWLVENDRFDEAQEALNKAGQQNQAAHLLEQLAENAITENRFSDGAYYYWMLAKSNLEAASRESNDPEGSVASIEARKKQFLSLQALAETYYAFHAVHRFVEQPFTAHLPEVLLNMARFLAHRINTECPRGVSKVSTFYILAKQNRHLGANKLARYAFDKLLTLRIPSALQETVDHGALTIRSKPFVDKEELLPMCYRCSTTNPMLNATGNQCINCKQPFEFSFVSFEVLPVVEFVLEEGISNDEAVKLIAKEPPKRKEKEQWKETQYGNTQSLKLSEGFGNPDNDNEDDPFSANTYEGSSDFVPVVVGRSSLEALHHSEVFVKRWGAPLGNQYFKSIMPDVSMTHCANCNKIFHSEDYEVQVLAKEHCPFCRKSV